MSKQEDLDNIWGPQPSEQEYVCFLKRNNERIKDFSKKAIDVSDESQLFAQKIGISVEDLWTLGDSKKVVTFSIGSTRYYPTWQIKDGVLVEGLPKVIEHFNNQVELVLWGIKPNNSYLEGKTPAEALAEGNVDSVMKTIAALNEI